MRRRRQTPELGSLDSLLDTVTNVVGILVLVLVVAMLFFRETMGKVRAIEEVTQTPAPPPSPPAPPPITVEDVGSAQADRDRLVAALSALAARWPDIEARIASDAQEIDAVDRAVRSLEEEVASPTPAPVDLGELESEHAARIATADELARKLETAKDELARLQEEERMERERQEIARKDRTLSLPDPDREAGKVMTAVHVNCKRNAICPLELKVLTERLDGALRASGASSISALDRYFNNNDIGDAFFRLRLNVPRISPPLVYLRFERRPNTGESVEEMEGPGSVYRTQLGKIDSTKQYLLFTVHDDSFEIYLRAKSLARQAGIRTGWIPYGADEPDETRIIPPPTGGGGGGPDS